MTAAIITATKKLARGRAGKWSSGNRDPSAVGVRTRLQEHTFTTPLLLPLSCAINGKKSFFVVVFAIVIIHETLAERLSSSSPVTKRANGSASAGRPALGTERNQGCNTSTCTCHGTDGCIAFWKGKYFFPPFLLFFPPPRHFFQHPVRPHHKWNRKRGREEKRKRRGIRLFGAEGGERKETIEVGGGGLLSRNGGEENWRRIFSFPRKKEKKKKIRMHFHLR